jgi:CheY-like chemotaxis protein
MAAGGGCRPPCSSRARPTSPSSSEGVTDSQRENVDQILRAGHHLLGLINEILDISRIENNRLGLSIEPVSVATALDEAVDLMAPMASRRDVEVLFEGPIPAVHVMADGQRLKQVLLNLLSNAIKYNRRDGAVWIRCAVDGDMARFEVRDTGRGIRRGVRDRLFQPFDRLGAEQSGEDGSGLGLVLSQRLVGATGGHLDLDRGLPVEKGSRFWFELPLATRLPGESREFDDELGSDRELPAAGRAGTVLYVEDTRSNVDLVARILNHRPELSLVSTAQGERALELAAAHAPVVILLDLHLPDISGLEVLARVRAEPRTATTPVVVVTADASQGQQARLLAAGADAFLTKPVSVSGLLAVIDAVTQKTLLSPDRAPDLSPTG